MIDREGNLIEYQGCTEITPGLFIGDGEVYLHDREGEICCWIFDELAEDPGAVTAAMTAVALAAKKGVSAVRHNAIDRGTTLGELVKKTAYMEYMRAHGK